jgi:hypothetical protein
MSEYFDYRYRFPLSGLVKALSVMDALRNANLMLGNRPLNMLGGPLDEHAEPTDADTAAFLGAVQDGYVYVHVRSVIRPELVPDPTQYGMEPVSKQDSAAVLGVWAGDEL